MKFKKITASLAALAIVVSAMNLPIFSKAEIDPGYSFWEDVSNTYGFESIKADSTANQIYYGIDEAMRDIWEQGQERNNPVEAVSDSDGQVYYRYYKPINISFKCNSEEEFNDSFAEFEKTALETFAIYLNDHPQVYFSSSIIVEPGTYDSNSKRGNQKHTIRIVIDEDFHDIVRTDSAKGREAYKQDIYQYRKSSEKWVENCKNDYEKIKALHDGMCKVMKHPSRVDNSSLTRTIIGAADNGKNWGFSECYAKTFQFLLNNYDIENVYVTGCDKDGNSKAWNIVKLDNGRYYGFDSYEDDVIDWDILYDSFAKGSESDFDETHIAKYGENESGTYLYSIPELAFYDFESKEIGNSDVLTFIGNSATLTDGVKFKFHAKLNKNLIYANDYIEFTSESGDITQNVNINEGEYDEKNDAYVYSLDLRPDQMNEKITATFISENPDVASVSYPTYVSVKDYVSALKDSPESNEELNTLVDSMLNYGAYAQLYTSNNLDAIDESDYPDLEAPELSVFDKEEYDPSVDGSAEGVTVKAATLLIGSKVDIRVTYDIEGFAGNVTPGDGIEYKNIDGKTAYAYVRGILPQSFDKARDITVDFDGEEVTLNFSPFSYMKYAFNDETTDRKVTNLLAAMYKYYEAASAYETASGNENASASNQ